MSSKLVPIRSSSALSDPLALPMLEDFYLYWWSIRNLIYSALIYFEVVLFYFSHRKGSYNFLKSISFWMVYLTHSVLMDGLVLILLITSRHNIIISYIYCCPLPCFLGVFSEKQFFLAKNTTNIAANIVIFVCT